MSLKSKESFLRYLTMGALGSARVAADLTGRGHKIIELERYTTSNKIWATKIKRLRLPDLLCIACGTRIEARAKSKLEVKLSDSPSRPDRRWDYGMNDNDLVAFLLATWEGDVPVVGRWVDYFRVGDLRSTVGLSKLGPAKPATEGAERDRAWPATTSRSYSGRVIDITSSHIILVSNDGRRRPIPLRPGFLPYVAPGDTFEAGARLIAGVVPRPASIDCAGICWDPLCDLDSHDPGMRYAAVRALAFRETPAEALKRLYTIGDDATQDERIRLEALASLARRDPDRWVTELGRWAQGAQSLEMAMEAVFILSELPFSRAADELVRILNRADLHEELRAAAAWGLGCCGHNRPELLLPYIDDPRDEVAVHCLVGIGSRLPEQVLERVGDLVGRGDRAAASAVHVLARHGAQGAAVLLQHLSRTKTGRASVWIRFGLGLAGRDAVRTASGGRVDATLADQLEPLWVGLGENWLTGDQASLIKLLHRQTIRELLGVASA